MSIKVFCMYFSLGLVLTIANGCAVVETGGKLMNAVGDGLSGYSKNNDGFIGKAAGAAGGIYSSAGTITQEAARGTPKDQPLPASISASAPSIAASK